MPLYEYECPQCGRYYDEFHSYKDRHEAYCCGKKSVKLISLNFTSKDKAYEFTTEAFDGRPVQVRSKGQYKRLLKKHGVVDASPRECFDQAAKNRKYNEVSREISVRKRAREMAQKMHQANVVKEGKEILTKMVNSGRR